MATQTKNLKLIRPSGVQDPFSTSDFQHNWDKIDESPGVLICTSTTRPTLAANQAGRHIYETDSKLAWIWNGTQWQRASGRGMLTRSDGSPAIAQRFTDFSSTARTSTLVAGVSNVVVPPGRRALLVSIMWSRAYSTSGYFYGRCHYQSGGAITSGGGTQHLQWAITGASRDPDGTSKGGLGVANVWFPDGLEAGVYGFSFQCSFNPGIPGTPTMTVTGAPNNPLTIAVLEL